VLLQLLSAFVSESLLAALDAQIVFQKLNCLGSFQFAAALIAEDFSGHVSPSLNRTLIIASFLLVGEI
jgi:hypothetical protein